MNIRKKRLTEKKAYYIRIPVPIAQMIDKISIEQEISVNKIVGDILKQHFGWKKTA